MARHLDAAVCTALVEAGRVSDEEWERDQGPFGNLVRAACLDSGPLQTATWDAALRALCKPRTEVRACGVLAIAINSSAARQRQACARVDIIRALSRIVEAGGHHNLSGTQAAQALSTLFCNPSDSHAAATAILAAAPGIVPSLCRLLVSLATPATYKIVTCVPCVSLLWGLASWDAAGGVAAQALQCQGLADALRRVAGASRAPCAALGLNRRSETPEKVTHGRDAHSFSSAALMVCTGPVLKRTAAAHLRSGRRAFITLELLPDDTATRSDPEPAAVQDVPDFFRHHAWMGAVNVAHALIQTLSMPCNSQGEARAMILLLVDLTERLPPGLPEATADEMRRLHRQRRIVQDALRPSGAPPSPQPPASQRAEEAAARQRATVPPAPLQLGIAQGTTALGAAAGAAERGAGGVAQACAACGKARGAAGVKLRPCRGCYPVLTTFYCSVSGGWRNLCCCDVFCGVCICVRARVSACMRASVRACTRVRVCERACKHVHVCVHACGLVFVQSRFVMG
jgi:hypothetical protein